MRDMTAGELHTFYKQRRMPCGCGTSYLEGPSGGVTQNIKCPECGLEINVDTTLFLYCGQVLFEPPGYQPPTATKQVPAYQRQPQTIGARLSNALPFQMRSKQEFTLTRKIVLGFCLGGAAYFGMRVYDGGRSLGYW